MMKIRHPGLAFAVLIFTVAALPLTGLAASPDMRAAKVLSEMTQEEKLAMLQGVHTWLVPEDQRPPGIALSAGHARGVPRLGIPNMAESDASLGVGNMAGVIRQDDEATAMPSGLAMASTWNTELLESAGRAIGQEARAKGLSVLLGGGVNLARDVRNGRNFEYLGEDPLLAGTLVGHAIRGVQSAQIVCTIKHFALNAQETGRLFLDVQMSEADMRESDLLAFQIGIEIGQPGSVMCAYNKVNGYYTCENDFLLNKVLRDDWGYKGWVMSDWGSVHSVSIPQGLDQESAAVPGRGDSFYDQPLRDALKAGVVTQDQIDQSVSRILRSMFAAGLVDNPVKSGGNIDVQANLELAQKVAEQGIVLLKNKKSFLPLAADTRRILLVGAHADKGVPSGGGSSQVWPVGGASLSLPIEGEPIYHRQLYMPSAPLDGIKEQFPDAQVIYDDGSDLEKVTAAAKDADVAIVFAEQLMAENHDSKNLSLPGKQDELITAVAIANPNTVVVLETGNPVVMPWLDKVRAVMAAWYAGNRGGHAIGQVLSGAVNPSGKLPITFPASLDQLPNPVLPGSEAIEQHKGGLYDIENTDSQLIVEYPEGSDVGYRWFARQGHEPLFPFGFGLSYTRFKADKLKVDGTRASFRVRNTGKRDGRYVAQLYLVARNGAKLQRLVSFDSVELAAGEQRVVTLDIDPRLLAEWQDDQWHLEGGSYSFALGDNASELGKVYREKFTADSWKD